MAALAFASSCRCTTPLDAVAQAPVRVTPSELRFDSIWVSQQSRRTVTLLNPNRTATSVEWQLSSPAFLVEVPSPLQLAGGEALELEVIFAPDAGGTFEATLRIQDAGVFLEGAAKLVPACSTTEACHHAVFDFSLGECVVAPLPDDTDCASPLSCFTSAKCHRGQCVGQTTDCSDGNPCTLDVCGADGCGTIDDTGSCPASTALCMAPSCDALSGCGETPVADGTPCGQRTCSEAKICIAGQCVSKPAPLTQTCAEVVAGWPAGYGFVDGRGEDARFPGFALPASLQYASDGVLYLGDGTTIRSISADGDVKTIAGVTQNAGLVDGFGATARLSAARLIGADHKGNLLIAEREGRSAQEPLVLRKATRQGLVTHWVGNPTCSASEISTGIGRAACLSRARVVGQVTSGEVLLHLNRPYEQRFYRVTSTGEVQFIGTLQLTVDGSSTTAVIANDEVALCVAELDGGTRVYGIDGGVLHRECPTPYRVSSDGTLFRVSDGSLVVKRGPPTDGPVSDAGIAFVTPSAIAEAPDGGLALWDRQRGHVRVVEHGRIRTLAGPVERRGRVDGPRALLDDAPRAISVQNDAVYFTDTGVRVYRPDSGVVSVLSFPCTRDLAVLDTRAAVLTCNGELHLYAHDWSAPTHVISNQLDAGWWNVALRTDGGILVLDANESIFEIQLDGGLHFVQQATGASRIKDRPQGLYSLRYPDFDIVDADTAVAISRNTVLRVTLNTTPLKEDVVMTLSDLPTSIAYDLDGGIYVGVPHALLHVRLP